MLFVLCDPKLNNESQLCIALRILCDFSIEEIARALLSNRSDLNFFHLLKNCPFLPIFLLFFLP